jgi:hypothetical protein
MKLIPEIEKAYRVKIIKATTELRAVLEGYVDCYNEAGMSAKELQSIINGTYSGAIGFVTQSFDETRCKHIFELLLDTKRKLGEGQ